MSANTGLTVRFYGTRGSLPSPGKETWIHGGNTSCVEIRAAGRLLVLDCGSGLRVLGNSLAGREVEADIFLSHYHWDHVMGLPFFAPLYAPGNVIRLHGEVKEGKDPRDIMSSQMIKPFFPVSMTADCKATVTSHAVAPGEVVPVGDARVTCCRLKHPGGSLAYRVELAGRSIVYATDTEPDTDLDERLAAFSDGADALIYDTTYTEAEYPKHVGWGHSTWQAGAAIARKANVEQLLLFHHLPERTDEQIALMEREARRVLPGATAAREGMTLELRPRHAGPR